MRIENPFHVGEQQAQLLAGESAIAARNSAVISDSIVPGALPFLKQQRMVVLGTQSPDGAVWASALFGAAGFATPLDARSVRFDPALMQVNPSDAFWENLRPGARAGMLAIELSTRRRLRVNGVFQGVGEEGFVLAVEEAYPNCPKYIQRRTLVWDEKAPPQQHPAGASGESLPDEVGRLLTTADTLFIASAHQERGADVSHRGGQPGFIELLDARTFRVPDYAGNGMFNTIGNLLADPRAGVTVMDFAGSRMLQMTGRVEVEWNQPDARGVSGGTGRFWTFRLDQWRLLALPGSARWQFLDASPYNPPAK